MKKYAAALSFIVATLLGVLCFILYQYSALVFNSEISSKSIPRMPLEIPLAAENQEAASSALPSPPPRLPYETTPSTPEPARTLAGPVTVQLNEIKRYLPEGTHIVTYPVSEREEKMAVGSADLNGDGNTETVVVYKAGADAHLDLTVFRGGGSRELHASVPLYGTYIQSHVNDSEAVPFALRDITGDGRPEIIVTTAIGASLGSELQVFSLVGSSLRQIASVSGHFIQVQGRSSGKASLIVARTRYEPKTRLYEWNGEHFEQKNR